MFRDDWLTLWWDWRMLFWNQWGLMVFHSDFREVNHEFMMIWWDWWGCNGINGISGWFRGSGTSGDTIRKSNNNSYDLMGFHHAKFCTMRTFNGISWWFIRCIIGIHHEKWNMFMINKHAGTHYSDHSDLLPLVRLFKIWFIPRFPLKYTV